jgi:hypothetical protein
MAARRIFRGDVLDLCFIEPVNKRMTSTLIEWRQLEDGTLEGSSDKYDFVIATDGAGVVLDVFATETQDNDDAHVESSYSNSVDEAKLAAEAYGSPSFVLSPL